ncbi:MAG: tripartite tricarboxylate transporter substrate binding protein [Variovorax sp.]|nr:MAG: tripartite tricarboxylate transporter substrate binding protein [Variovorax sp.]
MKRRDFIQIASGALAASALPAARADELRPGITLLVGFPPGGPTDGMARALAEPLRESLRSPLIVENRTGAGGRIAVTAAIRAPATGRTLLLTPGAMITIHPHLYPELPHDPLALLAPIALIGTTDLSIAVAADHPARNIDDLIRWFRQNAAVATCGTSGVGSVAHLVAAEMASKTGAAATLVHYRGALEEVTAIMEGSLKAAVVVPWIALPFQRAGKIRVLATTGPSRSSVFGDVSTMRESGIDVVAREWAGLFAPATTPPEALAAIGAAVKAALAMPPVRTSFAKHGLDPGMAMHADFGAFVRADYEHWGQIVKRAGIKVES